MIKRAIRLTSVVLSIFVFLLAFQSVSSSQQMLPLGTTERFDLFVGKSEDNEVHNEELISNLNKIVDQNDATLVKVSIDSDNYGNKKGIIWFGTEEPEHKGVVIENQKIGWLDSSLTGQFIPASDIGSQPLSGTYAVKGGEAFRNELDTWAKKNGLRLSWYKNISFFKNLNFYLFLTGVGNAVLSAFLLLLTTLISWFVIHAKSRTLRLLGGVSLNRIHFEDMRTIISLIAPSVFVGWIVSLLYVALKGGTAQVSLVGWKTFVTLIAVVVLIGVFATVFSLIASPKSQHIAQRQIPLKRFKQLGNITGAITIFLALLVVPSTASDAIISYRLAKEHSLWQSMQKTVRMSFSEIDPLETKEMLPEVESLFKRMQSENNLRTSLVIDKAISMTKEEMGEYDHVIITDNAWVDAFGVGIDKQGTSGKLTSIDFHKISLPLATFFKEQLPLWTKTGEMQPDGVGFYEYTGNNFIALPPNVGLAKETVQAKNPLVILVDDPVSILKMKGFLLYAASSGNVVFSNEEKLRSALDESPVKPYVPSIDGIADLAIERAQKFNKEGRYYMMACILILSAMLVAGIMSAQLWVGTNRKRIFTLHTFGRTYSSIIKPIVRKELFTVPIVIIVGAVVAYKIKYPSIFILIIVALSIALLYAVGSLLAYRLCARQTFHQTSHRYY